MNFANQLNSRTWIYRFAWILFVLGLYGSGFHIVAKAAEWTRAYQRGVVVVDFLELMVFVLSLFTNVIFLFIPVARRSPSLPLSWKVLLLGSLVVNVSVVLLFPTFLRQPGTWLWLLAFAAANWALIFLPLDAQSAQPPRIRVGARASGAALSDRVPALLWIWIAFTFFWIGVTTVNYVQITGPSGTAWNAPSAALRPALLPAPLSTYFNDRADLISVAGQENFNLGLAAFEKSTSNQLAVAIYPHAPAGPVEDFTIRTAELSRLGRRGRDNGAILFVFLAERIARIEVGYGLEGALTDAAARGILDKVLAPPFARGEYQEGLEATLAAMRNTVGNEYTADRTAGTLTTLAQQAKVVLVRFGRQIWPFLRGTDLDIRIGISFFAALLGIGVWSALVNTVGLLHAMGRGALNLFSRRPARTGIAEVQFEPIVNTVKMIVLAIVLGGAIVMVAGGGTFGGGGAMIRW